jgi:arabinogalactan oligomer/maltooligosaccharide transport system substrate-binding protein
MDELWRANALLEVTEDVDAVIEENGGESSAACKAAMRDGKLYAYPETAGNGYFLFYNSKYFNKDDVTSLDRIMEVAAENNKEFCMDFSSGWYIYSFFKGAGLELGCNKDGVTNYCNWNATDTDITGEEVAQAMLDIAQNKGFYSCTDELFTNGAKDGSVIACISGAWDASIIKDAFGDGYAAAKLPQYTVAGRQVQMCSFTGYKLVGVNAYTQNAEWAMRLARKITNEKNQLRRFEDTGECPSNVNAAASDEVKAAPAVAALSEQSKYGYIQSVAEPFWNASSVFGITIAGGNADKKPLQTLLDTMVEDITAKGAS